MQRVLAYLTVGVIGIFVWGSPTQVGATIEDIGAVTEATGQATILRQGQSYPVAKGFKLMAKDVLQTGADGSLGILFKDETTLSLGPKSEMAIDDYSFIPDQSRFSFVVKVVSGTVAYVSGLIAKLCPESARFITPSASIGIRGTKMVIQVE